MIKKMSVLGLFGIMAFFLAACGSKNNKNSNAPGNEDDVIYWNVKTVSSLEKEISDACQIKVTRKINLDNYKSLVENITEEYYTHPNAEEIKSLDNDTIKTSSYINTPITKATQSIAYYGEALKQAISDANEAGGGIIEIPENTTIYTGAIKLLSNVYIDIPESSTIKFVRMKTNEYYPLELTRFEGVECYNFSSFIYAYEVENIGIIGKGTLDGQADYFNWMPWKYGLFGEGDQGSTTTGDKGKLFKQGKDGVLVSERIYNDSNSTLRPNFIQPYKCNNVVIKGITIINSPMWEINPVLSENVIVDGVTINSKYFNNDGFDPECSKKCIIRNSTIATGDDCISLKSGRDEDGRRVGEACESIIIRDNKFEDGHGAITFGSDTAGDIRNVYAINNELNSKDLWYPIRYKSSNQRGGTVENIYIKNMDINNASKAIIHYDFRYDNEINGNYPPKIQNVYLSDIKTKGTISCADAVNILGFSYGTMASHYLKNIELNVSGNAYTIYGGRNGENLITDFSKLGFNYKNVVINGVSYKN